MQFTKHILPKQIKTVSRFCVKADSSWNLRYSSSVFNFLY